MGPQAAQAAKITSEMTLSEKADAIEEHMMHELDKIVTKSVLRQPDRRSRSTWKAARRCMKKIPGQVFQHGRRTRACRTMPEKPTLAGLLQEPASPRPTHLLQSARLAMKNGVEREDRPGVPAARHRDRRLHPERPRLLERPAAGARTWTRRWPGGFAYHQALRFFPERSLGGLSAIPSSTASSSGTTTCPSRTSRKPTPGSRESTSGT